MDGGWLQAFKFGHNETALLCASSIRYKATIIARLAEMFIPIRYSRIRVAASNIVEVLVAVNLWRCSGLEVAAEGIGKIFERVALDRRGDPGVLLLLVARSS